MAVFRSKNKWKAQVWIEGKRVKSKSFERKVDAIRWFERSRLGFENDSAHSITDRSTFDDLVLRFRRDHLPSVRPETAKRYRVDIERRVHSYFQYRKLSSITSEMIEEFKLSITSQMRSPKSVNNCLHTLRLMLNKAVKWKMLSVSPYNCDSIKIPRNYNYQWWDNKDYIQAFLKEARIRSRYYAAYVLALETGMRLGEIVGLNIEDIDLKRGRIRVWRQWNDYLKTHGPCKHDIERYIDFNPRGNLGKALRTVMSERSEGAVFTNSVGNRATKDKICSKQFKSLVRKAKVPVIPFHALRHTFASWFMSEIGDIWALKYILGHGDIRTTQIYAHHSRNQRRPVLDLTNGITLKSLPKLDITASTP